MEIARSVQEEFARRDEVILALEMLVVEQASRLLALEAVVVNMTSVGDVKPADVEARIGRDSARFRKFMEGDGLTGFVERANRVAAELVKGAVTESSEG